MIILEQIADALHSLDIAALAARADAGGLADLPVLERQRLRMLGDIEAGLKFGYSKNPEMRHLLPDTRDDQSSSRPLHKVHLRLTKLSAMPILKSSQRDDEMLWGERFGQPWNVPDVTCFGFVIDFCSRLLLRLRRTSMALAQAIGSVPALRAVHTDFHGSRQRSASVVISQSGAAVGVSFMAAERPQQLCWLG